MRMPPVLLSGRFPSASVPQGSFWLICVGRLVLLVPPAPPVPAEEASLGCLVPRCLGPLKALAAPWRRTPPDCLAPGPLGSWEVLASPWWRVPRGRLLPRRQGPSKAVRLWHHASGLPVLGRRVPLKALAAPWGRAPLVLLLQGLLVPWRTAVRSWWRAILGCGLPCLRVPLKVLVSPWWQPPPSCLAPGLLGASQVAVAAS